VRGLPTPEQVGAWWEDSNPGTDPPPKSANRTNHLITEDETDDNPATFGGRDDYPAINQGLIAISPNGDTRQPPGPDHSAICEGLISENGLPKRDTVEDQDRDHAISPIGDSGTVEPPEKDGSFTEEQAKRIRSLVEEGMSERWARRTVLADGHPIDCDCEACP
jgi:hypothetical protein